MFSGNELELEEEEEEEEQVDEGEELEQVAGKSGDTQEDGDVVANAKARLTAATAAVVVVLFTEAAADWPRPSKLKFGIRWVKLSSLAL